MVAKSTLSMARVVQVFSLATGAERRSMQWDNLLTTIHELKVGNSPNRNEPRQI
ncbi:hypothetical protein [Bremerella cremea]|uniref:hypothetical protein n=1 Tax=Bremerella cremea TaxID=1031537 RepID=UPI00131499D1|nr:hypothetical protein [Bremerella cremea]